MEKFMIPSSFVYVENGMKIYMSIISQFRQHFTGKTVYRVRREGDTGWVHEEFYLEEYILLLLKNKVEE